jgi:hypothetical protein
MDNIAIGIAIGVAIGAGIGISLQGKTEPLTPEQEKISKLAMLVGIIILAIGMILLVFLWLSRDNSCGVCP